MRKLLLLFALMFTAGIAGAQCTAALNATANPSGNNLLNASYSNTSYYGLPFTGQKMKFNIYYGDGAQLLAYQGTAVPDHVYAAPGTYIIGFRMFSYDSVSQLTVCSDTTSDTVTVAYPPCGTSFTVTGAGATKTVTATNPAGTPGISYSWTFGDGGTGTGASTSHTYTTTGTWTITLTATVGAPYFCTYTNTTTVYVYIPPPPLNCSILHASFGSAVASNTATFTNTSSAVSGLYKEDATWYFGDGNTATGVNTPPHAYAAPGVYTVSLKMIWHDSLNTTICTDSVAHTVTITAVPPPPNIISGNVNYPTGSGTSYFKVYLIKFDSATNWLYAVDSVITGNTNPAYYAFGNKAAGSYRTKAAIYNGTSTTAIYIPTYHDSSVYWSSATVINHAGLSTLNQNILMRTGVTGITGPGFIGGNVSYGANKGTNSGGVSNLLIFLRDANMKVIQTQRTDSAGNYSFPNIPYGPYSIWPELMNYSTMPVTPIVLNATYPSRSDINFYQDDSKHSIAPPQAAGVGSLTASAFITVAPVPASDKVTIYWNGLNDAQTQFTITNITGKVIATTQAVKGRQGSIELNVSGWARGLYFVHGSGTLTGSISKLVVE